MELKRIDQAFAHTRQNSDGSYAKPHDLEKHLVDVARTGRLRRNGNGLPILTKESLAVRVWFDEDSI